MTKFLDRDRNPLTLIEWATKYEETDYRRIAFTPNAIPDVHVSTIWQGFDPSNPTQTDDEPIVVIFETIILSTDPQFKDRVWGWATEEDARTAHDAIVESLRDGTFAVEFGAEQ